MEGHHLGNSKKKKKRDKIEDGILTFLTDFYNTRDAVAYELEQCCFKYSQNAFNPERKCIYTL